MSLLIAVSVSFLAMMFIVFGLKNTTILAGILAGILIEFLVIKPFMITVDTIKAVRAIKAMQ